METIQATVNPRLLTKANRLFTGTLQGRIIEILQNARRAGATKVEITNQDGHVTVHDNGEGIDDFARLLDLGGSGWEQELEASEDPAGVGLFCLAPRDVTIRSHGKLVKISGDGWTGAPMTVRDDPEPAQGTVLHFEDEPWFHSTVEPCAVFTGLEVVVDGQACARETFLGDQAVHHPELGCKIEVRERQDLNPWHQSCQRGPRYCDNVLVNFHGQTLSLDYHPVGEHHLYFLVDMTGEPTGIRLMLPARTCLVENEAFETLKAALELEAYRYLQRRGQHRLPYKDYLRASDLGITLPEATPTFTVGLLSGDTPEPVEVTIPEGFPLARFYRFDPDFEGTESDASNAHLLAALGTFREPFVAVEIAKAYDGYAWTQLPTIGKVKVQMGKKLQRSAMWSGELTCVDSITITACTSDGKTWRSPVCMAILPPKKGDDHWYSESYVHVTPEAQRRLTATEVWYHLGGWYDEGDTYDTQASAFSGDLEQFWARLVGPYEQLRRAILETLGSFEPKWKTVSITSDGKLTIRFNNGSKKIIDPPKAAE